jgi:hypothetical protein
LAGSAPFLPQWLSRNLRRTSAIRPI